MKRFHISQMVLGLALAASAAGAQDFHVNVDFGPGAAGAGTITAYRDNTGALYSPYAGSILSGRFHVTTASTPVPGFVPAALSNGFYAYCVDISNLDASQTAFKSVTYIDGNALSGSVLKKGTSNGGGLVAADGKLNIFGRLQEASWLLHQYGIGSNISGDAAAGVQLAVWNVLEDTDFTISSGANSAGPEGSYFTASGFSAAALTDANADLTGLKHALDTGGGKANGYYLHTEAGQDILAAAPDTSVTPEGSSLLLVVAGVVPICLLLRRARRKAVLPTP